MVRRLLILGSALLLLPGCFATGAAKAVQGALNSGSEPPVVHVQAPDVSVTFEDIVFQQVPIGALEAPPVEADAAGTPDAPPVQPQAETDPVPDPGPEADTAPEADAGPWIHAEPMAQNPDPFDRSVIRDALGPVFRDLDDRIESIDDRLSSMEGG